MTKARPNGWSWGRIVKRCFSISFWTSRIRGRLQKVFGVFVRKTIISAFCFAEFSIGASCALFYLLEKDVASLGWGYKRSTGYTIIAFARAFQGGVGLVAARKRKVKMMRRYVLWLPVAILYTGYLSVPLIRLDCYCTDFRQCKILGGFVSGGVVNVFPDPNGLRVYVEPNSFVEEEAHEESKNSNEAESEEEDRRLASGELIKDPKEKAVFTWGKTRVELNSLLNKTCTCYGEIYGPHFQPWLSHQGRHSCRFWPKPDYHGKITHNPMEATRSWCLIRKASEKTCLEDKEGPEDIKGARRVKEGGVARFQSKDLCSHKKCVCSGIGMPPTNSDRNADRISKIFVDATHGRTLIGGGNPGRSNCQRWRTIDARPWCFVGFDSPCPDREIYTLSKDEVEEAEAYKAKHPQQIEAVSQFRSWLPCDRNRRHATEICLAMRDSLVVLLAILTLLTMLMTPVMCLYVQNRCGDLLEVTEEFEVYFSSDEDDFDTRQAVEGVDSSWDDMKLKPRSPKSTKGGGKGGKQRSQQSNSIELAAMPSHANAPFDVDTPFAAPTFKSNLDSSFAARPDSAFELRPDSSYRGHPRSNTS